MDRHTTSETDRRGTTEADQRGRPAMDRRAISEVLGFALVFGLIVSLVILVSVVGFDELEDTRDREELNNAERAFDVLADNMRDIHAEGAPSRATEINLESARLEVGEPISINVTGVNQTGASFDNVFTSQPIVYASGDSTLVYAGGAVFRTQGDGGFAVNEPPFVLNSKRVVLPIVQTRHQGEVTSTSGSTVRVRAENRQRQLVRGFNESPTSFDKIIINITSPRSNLWRDYLTSQNGVTNCTQPRPNNIRCTIDNPQSVFASRTLVNYAFES
ncbi:DUF7289 family protein [Halapricum hydrolyticum]|uniref:Uncharacterized protein n=1 Tax=Halapricum hydrolyticum TaxID=2979991 RepID=A0AAE3ICB1_9EURY|nr:hypothetical protein [Halapricum hydrolyticum]MCU4716615.1 hypothetical protein [Halapricum hydrolyticum]MCU4725780.1 hypothetical protein [Halapricum hydrolyticum]